MAFSVGGIKVHGVEEAVAALVKVDLSVREAMKLVVRAAGEVVAKDVQQVAPFRDRTGRLRKSVKVRRVFFAGGQAGALISYGAGQFYGKFQEKGSGHQRAYPFLVPGLDAAEEPATEEAKRIYRVAIDRVV